MSALGTVGENVSSTCSASSVVRTLTAAGGGGDDGV